MLYWLLYQKLYPFFHPFRIFRFITFRTAFASGTALLIQPKYLVQWAY